MPYWLAGIKKSGLILLLREHTGYLLPDSGFATLKFTLKVQKLTTHNIST